MPAWLRRVALAAVLSPGLAFAQAADVRQEALRPGHPLIGVWRFDVPGTTCHETYTIRADGSSDVTSGSQVARSVFQISPEPSARGFYKWVDKIVQDNGKPDCTGEIGELGHVATNYIRLSRDARQFLMCQEEELRTCIGPLTRQESI